MNQHGRLVDFRLTARRAANAARAFLRQVSETVHLYQPLTIVTDKTYSYGKVIGEWNARLGPDGPEHAISHVTRKHENNRIEGDHAVLKHRLRPIRGLQGLSSAKATLEVAAILLPILLAYSAYTY